MQVYPQDILPDEPYSATFVSFVDIFQADSGLVYSREIADKDLATFQLAYSILTPEEAGQIVKFFKFHRQFSTFIYFDFVHEYHFSEELIESPDGDQTVFTIPAMDIDSTYTVYLDGTATTANLLHGSGTYGEDQFQFMTAPEAGTILTIDFVGKKRYKAKFSSQIQVTQASNNYRNISVSIQEVF